MLRRLFCAILGIISINPNLRTVERKIEVGNEFKIATILTSDFIDKVEHYQQNEGVKTILYKTFEVWDDTKVKRQGRIGWYCWVDTDHKKYRRIGMTLDVERYLVHDPDSAIGDVMNLTVTLVRDYFLNGVKPQNAEQYLKELEDEFEG